MKKIFALLLAGAMMLGVTACGNSADSSEAAPPADSVAEETAAAEDATGAEEPEASEEEADEGGDWAYIQDKGEMIIGITYFEPMNYLTDSGELTGFETEFAEAVCEILGVTPVFQEISWSAKEIELNAKNIDCIWNGMTIDEERKANMSISQPYMQNMQVLVVKSANEAALAESVEGLYIVAEAGSAGESVAEAEDFFADAVFTPVDTQAKALMEASAGTADGAVVDYVASIGMIGEGTDFADLVAVESRVFGQEEYGIAMRKSDTEFTQKINDAINELIDNGTLLEIAQKYKLEEMLITG